MYNWRKLTVAQREELFAWRKQRHMPWHSPPHMEGSRHVYHLSAACYEHHPIIGANVKRMAAFAEHLLDTLTRCNCRIHAWCVLPNHYHILIGSDGIRSVIAKLGRFHGRMSYIWNTEDDSRGRQVWCKSAERSIRSDRHHWATTNYIHNNPVRHGDAKKWQEWPYSSAIDFLNAVGISKAKAIWTEYPVLDYGKGWDDV